MDEVERIERIDRLADRMLLMERYADMPATEVWDLAAERVDEAEWKRTLARIERDLGTP